MSLFWLLATMLLAGSQNFSYGGTLREIWKLDLSATIDTPSNPKLEKVPVYAIRFSPNGQQIAVSVISYLPRGNVRSKLIVVQTKHPNDTIRKFDIKGTADDYQYEIGASLPVMMWSPSADGITAGESVIRLDAGKTCTVAGWRGPEFIGSDRVLSMAPPRDHQEFIIGNEPTRFNIFDKDCQLREHWDLEREVSIDDISAERGLLYGHVFSMGPKPQEELVIDSTTKTILRTSPGWGGSARFALHGKAICSGRIVPEELANSEAVLRCFDVESGKTIAEASSIRGGSPIFAAESASRIVAHDFLTVRIPFTNGEYGTLLKRRVVWDFETNNEIVSWGPPTQTFDIYDKTGRTRRVKEPFRVAISPDGQFIAEGGNGVLHLYEIAQ